MVRFVYSILTAKKLHTYSSFNKRERVLRRLARIAKVPEYDSSKEPAWFYDMNDCPATLRYNWPGYEFNQTRIA